MSQIEELLREALADSPTPPMSAPDPVGRLTRRVRTVRRRRFATASVLAAAAVTAAAVTPAVLLSNDAHPRQAPPAHQPTPAPVQKSGSLQTWRVPGVDVEGVTYAAGSVWLSGSRASGNTEGWRVVRMNPSTGKEISRVQVPGPVSWAAYGLGRIWLFGGGDGAFPQSVIDVLDPATGHLVASTTIPPSKGGPQPQVAFAHGSVWFPLGDVPELLRVTLTGHQLRTSTLVIGTTSASIAATGDGKLWLGRAHGKVTEVLPTSSGARLGRSNGWSSPLLSAAGSGAVWTTDGASASSRVIQLDPAALAVGDSAAQLDRVLPGFAATVAVQNSTGLWIGGDTELAFYSTAALSTGTYPPTAKVKVPVSDGATIVQLAPVGASVVFVDSTGQVRRWTPSV
jgi:hypothetical protein